MDAAPLPTPFEDPAMIDRSNVCRFAATLARRAVARLGGCFADHIGACLRTSWMLARRRVLTVAAAAAVATVTPAVAATEQPVAAVAAAPVVATPAPLDASWADAAAAITEQDVIDTTALSCTVKIGKFDSRCRGWAIVVRDGTALPSPADVGGAGSLGLPYLRQVGTEELFGTDAVFWAEENHHRKSRGWSYQLRIRDPEDNVLTTWTPGEDDKRRIKAAMASGKCTMPREYLKGSGEVAAMVRVIQALRHGMTVADFL